MVIYSYSPRHLTGTRAFWTQEFASILSYLKNSSRKVIVCFLGENNELFWFLCACVKPKLWSVSLQGGWLCFPQCSLKVSRKPHSEMHCFSHSARWYPAVITSAEGGLHLLDIIYCWCLAFVFFLFSLFIRYVWSLWLTEQLRIASSFLFLWLIHIIYTTLS